MAYLKIIMFLFMYHFLVSLLTSCEFNEKINIGKEVVLRLEPSDGNPRNSEGDFLQLKDGRIIFIYSHFTSGSGDNAGAYLASRYSSDEGRTWSDVNEAVLRNEGSMNVMSVSLFRLSDDRIALFYLRKNSESDCIPYIRKSVDEAKSWSKPTRCIPDSGYFVVNNDRVIRLRSGRIIFPASLHKSPGSESTKIGKIRCYYSDDEGETWIKGHDALNPEEATTQEPGLIELNDSRIMLFCRTESGTQYFSYSSNQGESWSILKAGNIRSPLSPASIERIPRTGDLMLVWNNNYKPIRDGGKRTPFNLAISRDEGATWEKTKTIESDPNGWYCYTAIDFIGDNVLLGHCAGDTKLHSGLATTQITRLSLDWIYCEATPEPTIKTDSNGVVELHCSDKRAQIYYSLERKQPNILYELPISISRTTPLWALATVKGKSKSGLLTAYVGSNILQPSIDNPISEGRGLTYKYYEDIIFSVDQIEKLAVKEKGVIRQFKIDNRQRDSSFAYLFSGYISIPSDGKYTFFLSSNDGSILFIGGTELINHDGGHSMSEESASISLGKGNHKIILKYFQMLGGLGLVLSWKGPGFEKEEIPESVLFH